MKKKISLIFIILILLSLDVEAGNMEIFLGQSPKALDFSKELGQPYINQDQRTMVPLRFIAESLDYDVDFLSQRENFNIVVNKNIFLTDKSDIIIIGDTRHKMDTQALIGPDNRTYVPLRFVAEALGYSLDYTWDGGSKVRIIETDKQLERFDFEKSGEFIGPGEISLIEGSWNPEIVRRKPRLTLLEDSLVIDFKDDLGFKENVDLKMEITYVDDSKVYNDFYYLSPNMESMGIEAVHLTSASNTLDLDQSFYQYEFKEVTRDQIKHSYRLDSGEKVKLKEPDKNQILSYLVKIYNDQFQISYLVKRVI